MHLEYDAPQNNNAAVRIGYLIPEQAWMASVVMGVEVFNAVEGFHQNEILNQYSRTEVHFLRVPGTQPKGFTGFSLPLQNIDQDVQYDVLIIPAAWRLTDDRLACFAEQRDWLRSQHERGAILVGLVTSVFYLAETGLLDGGLATTHWAFVDQFKHRYPQVKLNAKQSVVEAGNIYCTGNYRGSVDVVLILIRRFFGEQTAQRCDRYFALSDTPIDNPFEQMNSGDTLVDAFKSYVGMNLNSRLALVGLASEFNVSTKTLSRRCTQVMGITPMNYVQQVRLNRAKDLLMNTSYHVDQIAEQSGFASATVFGRAFKQRFGKAPTVYRAYIEGRV